MASGLAPATCAPKDSQRLRERLSRGRTPDWKKANNVPTSPVSLVCVTSGKSLSLSGPHTCGPALPSGATQSGLLSALGPQDIPAEMRGEDIPHLRGPFFLLKPPSSLALSHLMWLPDLQHPAWLCLLDNRQVFNLPSKAPGIQKVEAG